MSDSSKQHAQTEERIVLNTEIDQEWADYLAPTRRNLIYGLGAAAVSLFVGNTQVAAIDDDHSNLKLKPIVPPADKGMSPWGTETYKEATPKPKSLWPGYPNGLPEKPRPYTDIKSYHAHFYFDEDSYEKAALVRKWSAERFSVELEIGRAHV